MPGQEEVDEPCCGGCECNGLFSVNCICKGHECDLCGCCNGAACGTSEDRRYCCRPVVKSFAVLRKLIYGSNVAEDEDGRNCCLRCMGFGKECEHMLMVLITAVFSVADTVSDILVVIKWLTSTPESGDYHDWEAYTLLTILGVSWFGSALCSVLMRGRCSWSTPFHLIGLGTPIEALRNFFPDPDNLEGNTFSNINPYKWIEILFENGPSALVTVYVTSLSSIRQSQNTESVLFTLESLSVLLSLLSIAYGTAQFLVVQVAQDSADGHINIGERGFVRTVFAGLLILADVIHRMFVVVFWMNYVTGFEYKFVAFLVVFSIFFAFELFICVMNGMVLGCWQLPLLAYANMYQGGIYFFSRRWGEKGHRRNIFQFFLRFMVNWTIFMYLWFGPIHGDLNGNWGWSFVVSGLLLPTFFMLKPPALPMRDAYPIMRNWDEEGGCCNKMIGEDVASDSDDDML